MLANLTNLGLVYINLGRTLHIATTTSVTYKGEPPVDITDSLYIESITLLAVKIRFSMPLWQVNPKIRSSQEIQTIQRRLEEAGVMARKVGIWRKHRVTDVTQCDIRRNPKTEKKKKKTG